MSGSYRVVTNGGACHPPTEVLSRIIDGLSQSEKETVLANVAIYAPEAFENALSLISRARARRIKAAGS